MNLKYYGEWFDFPSNNKMRLEFYVSSAVSSPEPVIVRACSEERPSLSPFSDKSLFGSSLSITIVSPEPLYYKDSFYLADMKGMLVKLFMRYGQSGQTLVFIGYVNSEVYEDSFSQRKNYDIYLTANNGISLLDRLVLLDEQSVPFTGLINNMELIQYCLAQLEIPYTSIYIASLASVFSVQANETIFHKVFSKAENFYDETNTPMALREVLEGLLFSSLCKLYIYDNNIYIIDIGLLNKETIVAKQYNFSTLAYNGLATIKDGHIVLNELGVGYSLYMTPAKNKININFNKYINPQEEHIGVTIDNVSSPGGKLAFYDENDDFQYYEQTYFFCSNIERLPGDGFPGSQFVVRTDADGTPNESFIRIFPAIGGEFKVRLKSKRIILPSDLFIGIEGAIQFEDPDNTGKEKDIPAWGGYHAMPFYFRPVILGMDGQPNWSFLMHGITQTPYAPADIFRRSNHANASDFREREWQTGFHPIPVATMFPGYMQGVSGAQAKQYNKWYEINGELRHSMGRVVPKAPPYQAFVDCLYKWGIVIPLANFYENTENAPQGGFFALDIFMPAPTGVPPLKNMLLKDIRISVLREIDFTLFKKIEDTDTLYQIIGNPEHKDEYTIETTQGTDDLGLARGTYVLKTSGIYDATPATNERWVNLEKIAYLTDINTAQNPYNSVGANDTVYVCEKLDNGLVFIGGAFTSFNGVSLTNKIQFLLLNEDGTVNLAPPTVSGGRIVTALAYDSSYLYVGTDSGHLYKLSRTTGAILNTLVFNAPIYTICRYSGIIWVGGAFTSFMDGITPVDAYAIACIVTSTFSNYGYVGYFEYMTGIPAEVHSIVVTDAYPSLGTALFIGGKFLTYIEPNGASVNSGSVSYDVSAMIGIKSNGTLLNPLVYHQGEEYEEVPVDYTPKSFAGDPNAMNLQDLFGVVYDIRLGQSSLPDLYVVGNFRSFGGQPALNMARISLASGQLALGGNLPMKSANKIKIGPNNTLFIVGSSQQYHQQLIVEYDHSFNKLAFSDGAGFAPYSHIYDFCFLEDNRLLVAGDFSTYHNYSFDNILALGENAVPEGMFGAISSLEHINLMSYHAQLKQPRYVFTNVKIWQYPTAFASFQYALLARGQDMSIFVLNKMEIDYVNGTVVADLEEII